MASGGQSVCMSGEGETSYAKNSVFQSGVQSRVKPLVEEAISDLCGRGAAVPDCLRVADLGCSSGPNALALASAAVDAVRCQPHHRCREMCVYLNDLPENDFNAVFKDVPSFLRGHGGVAGGGQSGPPLVMVFGAPGSFYGRLFPTKTLHLVCSSFSLHWLTQVPQELVDGVLVNKGSVSAGRTSTPAVAAAYARQFEQDFRRFLALRAEEMVPGGWMVLSVCGRPAKDLSSQDRYPELVAEILQDLASQGLIAAADVDSFNEPFYSPCREELRGAVEQEGSFEVVGLESHGFVERAPRGDAERSRALARFLRVLDEWLLVRHFRVDGIGDAYARAAEERYMGPAAEEDMVGVVLILSLRLRRRK